ncbi:acetylglutamate kinase [Sulfurospirillum sp. 1612]|uniref:acetylglutamate kinase n=1 Tax=Sulfurospirillum sp. 1612 TaxID=3094835 RepID=UPI002F92C2C0
MEEKIQQARILMDALPYIRLFNKKTIVIKYGGSAQEVPALREKFTQDVVLLYLVGIKPIIVHGGGKKINNLLDKLAINSHFVDGLRVTDDEIMEVVEMVLGGHINKEITNLLNFNGAKAIGITGKDASFMQARALENGKYGLVGEITHVRRSVIDDLVAQNFIPVIAPIAAGGSNHPGFNVNADLAASEIAVALNAEKIIFLTDTTGILDKEKKLLSVLNQEDIKALKRNGTIHGGMIPKTDACLASLQGGVKSAHIIDGRIEHSILLELFTSDGIGTNIK